MKDNEKNDFFKSLKVLAVGNSFSDDAMEYVYQIAADYGIKQIVLGNLYIGGASLQIHYANSLTDDCDYEYRKNTIGNWENKSNVSLKTGLIDEGWDIVTLQQASGHSGEVSSYYPHLQYLIHYLKNLLRNPLAKIAWHLTWAYQQNSDHKDFPKYNNDQITMYQQIIAAVTSNIITNPEIDLIIPTGTAIQNLRTSYLGDTLTRDGFHLSFDIGRYTAGMVFFQALTGFDCQKINYKPKGVSAKDLLIIKEAVKNAILNSYEITISWTNKIKLSQ